MLSKLITYPDGIYLFFLYECLHQLYYLYSYLGSTPIHIAVDINDVNWIKTLAEQGANLQAVDEKGNYFHCYLPSKAVGCQ